MYNREEYQEFLVKKPSIDLSQANIDLINDKVESIESEIENKKYEDPKFVETQAYEESLSELDSLRELVSSATPSAKETKYDDDIQNRIHRLNSDIKEGSKENNDYFWSSDFIKKTNELNDLKQEQIKRNKVEKNVPQWHPELREDQILYALEKGIYEPVGDEYDQFLHELGINDQPIFNLSENEEEIKPEKTVVNNVNKKPELKWHPELTEIQILDALSRGIYEPLGDEYDQFLLEHGLVLEKPIKEKDVVIPIPTPVPVKKEDPKPPVKDPKPVEHVHAPQPVPPVDPPREVPKVTNQEIIEEIPIDHKTSKIARVKGKFDLKTKVYEGIMGISLAATLLSGFKPTDKIVETPAVAYESVENDYEDVHIDVTDVQKEEELNNIDETEIYNNINLGDFHEIKDGMIAETNSLFTGPAKSMGDVDGYRSFSREGKYEGAYEVSGFSIVNKQGTTIINYEQGFNGNYDGYEKNLGNFLNQVLEANNLSIDDVNVRLHYGINQDITRLGWIDITDILKVNDLGQSEIEARIAEKAELSGMVEKFEGDSISFENSGEVVVLKIKDADGNFLANGTVVTGSDGKDYRINDIESTIRTEIEQRRIETTQHKVVSDGIKWRLSNMSLIPGISALAAVAAGLIAAKRKNKKAEKDALFEEFVTEVDYDNFIDEVKEGTYVATKNNPESWFLQQTDEVQKLTTKQKIELGKRIDNIYGPNTIYYIDHGRIYVEDNGEFIDASDTVYADIVDIGKNNKVVAEGAVPEEYFNGATVGKLL